MIPTANRKAIPPFRRALANERHYEAPDAPFSKYQISYSLPPLHLEEFPTKLTNFRSVKEAYEQDVLNGNKEQKDVYVDPNASVLFNAIFPEIVASRGIGKLQQKDFDTWNFREKGGAPQRVLLERVFRMIDKDGNGTIEGDELRQILKETGVLRNEQACEEMFQAVDLDHNGVIDFDEFQEFWKTARFGDNEMQLLGLALRDHMTQKAKPLVENNVEILMHPKDLVVDEHVDFLCVGGPSTYAAALLHKAQYPSDSILHVVGSRFDSNADGSAYYYHERDAFPLYINKVNTGWYCVYADLMKRFRSSESLRDMCVEDRHHVKIAINWGDLLKYPWMVFSIFIPNTYHAFMDLIVRDPKDSLMQQACLHSQRVPRIVETVCEKLGLPSRAFLVRDPDRAVYIDVEGEKRAGEHFDWLNKYADIPYHSLDPSQFGSLVTQALAFDRDGALSPWMFENFYTAFEQVGIKSQQNWFLDSLYVQSDKEENHRLVGTAARFANCETGEVKTISFDKMTFSLGPSGRVVMDPSLSQDAPEDTSGMRTALNSVSNLVARGAMAHKGTMWAAGSSSVCLLGIKRGAASGTKLDTFRKFIDGVNQHWTLIKEREVTVGQDVYDFFVIQMTGGGNFPSRYTKPDFVLNLLYTTEEIFGLNDFEDGDIIYDIVQSRGCGRSVSARNTVGFAPLAKNIVSAYGLGGIGMTTAFANGALQLQVLESLNEKEGDTVLADGTSKGRIGSTASREKLVEFYGEDIFSGVNYEAMIDDPRKTARALGVDQTVTSSEKWMVGSIGTSLATAMTYLAIF